MAGRPNTQVRQEIFDSTTRIKQLTQEPSDFLTDILVQQQQYACIEWLFHFKILDHIPKDGSISYSELATKLNLSKSDIRATARMAMTTNLLSETENGDLTHNALSTALVENDGLSTWFSYIIKRSVPCMRTFPKASELWPDSTKGTETAYNVAMDTDLSFFDHLKQNQDLGAEFGRYMKSQSTVHAGASVDHLVKGMKWAALGEAKVVDVGGNSGSASIALAEEYANLSFVVQDLPEPIQRAREQAHTLSEDMARRIEFVEHDFFTPQPVKDADVYLLRMILHDWPDEKAVAILKHIAEAMKEGSRIFIMDMVLPAPGSGSPTLEAALRQKDLTMRQVLHARERELEDWRTLVTEADARLRIVAVRQPEGSQHSIIEIA